ncbi:hypothetical protein QUB32_06995 [Microcoleus sp. AT8-A4]
MTVFDVVFLIIPIALLNLTVVAMLKLWAIALSDNKGDRTFGYLGEKGSRYQFLLSNANSVNFYQ